MVKIKDINDPDEVRKVPRIEGIVWGTNEVTPYHVFIAGKYAGGVLKGAYVDDKLIGYVFGIPGIYKGKLCHYSHQLAVLPEYRNMGVGEKLKFAQREECLKKGLDLVIWTYDPLQSLNAYFNIRKLSVIVRTYLINHYGEMRDEINRGLPSDRFLAEWWIKSDWVINRAIKRKKEYFINEVPESAIKVEVRKFPIPVEKRNLNNDMISVPIPININRIKMENIELARKWRYITREIFTKLFNEEYVVIDYVVNRDEGLGYYILKRGFKP